MVDASAVERLDLALLLRLGSWNAFELARAAMGLSPGPDDADAAALVAAYSRGVARIVVDAILTAADPSPFNRTGFVQTLLEWWLRDSRRRRGPGVLPVLYRIRGVGVEPNAVGGHDVAAALAALDRRFPSLLPKYFAAASRGGALPPGAQAVARQVRRGALYARDAEFRRVFEAMYADVVSRGSHMQ